MSALLDEQYLTWLYGQIASVKHEDPAKTHWNLIRHLFKKEVVWLVPNDDNRLADGKELRYEFLADSGYEEVDPDWMQLGCSFLELLIGLSRRLSFETDREPRGWFWRMIDNLDLEECTDAKYNKRWAGEIEETLDMVIWRTYEPNGVGGLFPLEHPHYDQRWVEIWYQLSAYLLEQEV